MPRRCTVICLTLAALAPLAAPAAAPAKSTAPKLTRVAPMRLHLGGTVTIRGRGFSPRASRDTVIFRAPSGRSAFVKPRRATRRKLVLIVPSSLARLQSTSEGGRETTRFRLRVVVSGRFSRWTPERLSPVVVGRGGGTGGGGSGGTGGGSGGGGGVGGTAVDCTSGDYDGDLLSGATEAQIGTDPCLRDTDRDGVEDGYEEQAAIDLAHYPGTLPLPYPGKRPYPNALDPSDAGVDYDGDGLALYQEYTLWVRYSADGVARSDQPTTLSNLLYSDGLQESISPPPAAPADPLAAWALDMNDDGTLGDDERDGDGDGLGNWDEASGRMTEAWWPAEHDGTIEPTESKYPGIDFLDDEDLPSRDAFANPDLDGDAVLDGADDTDHDGLTNQFEVRRPSDWIADAITGFPTAANPWAYVQPFNPCKPYNSERCHKHPPFGYYDSDGVPPIGPDPPGGYPGTHPPTPDG